MGGMPRRHDLDQLPFERILDTMEDALVIATHDEGIIFMNQVAQKLYNVTDDELHARDPLDLERRAIDGFEVFTLDGDPLPVSERPTVRLLKGDAHQHVRILARHAGEEDDRMYVVRGRSIGGDRPVKVLSIRDDTDRWRAHQRFRVTFETDPAPSVVARLEDAEILMANAGMAQMTNLARTELEGRSLADLELLENNDALSAALEALRNNERIHKHKTSLKDASGTTLDVLVSARCIELARQACGIFTFVDISDFEATRREHERSRDELSHARSRLAQRREQQRIQLARDLHDGVLQDLLAQHTHLAQREDEFRRAGERAAADALRDTRLAVIAVVQDLRAAIRGLRPTAIRELGLWTSLRESLPDQDGQPDILLPSSEPPELPEDVLLTLYRTAQEAIRNAIKHARASRVTATLEVTEDTAHLRVADDGRGFIPPERLAALEQDDHFGLLSMDEDASAHGGDLRIVSAPGHGTTVSLRLPLTRSEGDGGS